MLINEIYLFCAKAISCKSRFVELTDATNPDYINVTLTYSTAIMNRSTASRSVNFVCLRSRNVSGFVGDVIAQCAEKGKPDETQQIRPAF